MSEDRPLPTPRTVDEPMAFTRDELTRGAWCAWLTFMSLMIVGVLAVLIANYVLHPDSGPLSGMFFMLLAALFGCVLIGGSVSMFVMVLVTLIALPIGYALRRTRHPALHLLSYSVLSIAVAVLGAFVAFPALQWLGNLGIAITSVVVIAAVASAPVGWWMTSRRALRDDVWRARSAIVAAPE